MSSQSFPNELTGRFKLLKCLGLGGLSSVFLVEDDNNPGIQLALKILNAKSIDSDNLSRFRKEFDVLTTLQHPNLIEAYELVELGNSIGYLMEYVEGSNLLEILRIKKPSNSEIDLIFSQVLAALFELHSNGLAHRDIKLENVLVRDDGFVKLSDLGLMKKFEGTQKTEAGLLLGTSQYLPPESVKHSIYDARSDIYATGLMLFECLTGKRWLEGKKGAKALRYLCDMNFEFPKLALVGLPYKYQYILKNALAVQPWKRFKDADAMRLAILSDDGKARTRKIEAVSAHLNIRAVHERRKTAEFVSIKAKRQKLVFGIIAILAGIFLAAILLLLTIGMAPDQSKVPLINENSNAAQKSVKLSPLVSKKERNSHVTTRTP